MPYNSNSSRATPGGGPLIPEEVQRDIVQSVEVESAALTLFPKVRMRRAQQRIPVMAQLPLAYWVTGADLNARDTGIKQTTNVAWDNVFLNAEEIAVIVPVAKNLIADMDYDFWEQVKPRVTEAFSIKFDESVFFQPGDKPVTFPQGIAQAAAAAGNSITAGAGVDFLDDVNNMMAAVEADGYDVNGFWARRQIKSKLRGLRSTTKELLYYPDTPPTGGGVPGGTLYGEPIRFSNAGLVEFSTGAGNFSMIGGDWTQGMVGIREDVSMEMFDQGVITDASGVIQFNLMQQDMVALRVTARFAFAVPNPINRQQPTAANRYPFGVIAQAAAGGEP
jgi:HK97 family phage major capsid protein